jgi:hypothetical protein
MRSPRARLKVHIALYQAYAPTMERATNTAADANVTVNVGLDQRSSLSQTPSCLSVFFADWFRYA